MLRTMRDLTWERNFSALGSMEVPAGAPVEWHDKNKCFYVKTDYFELEIIRHDARYYGCNVHPSNVTDDIIYIGTDQPEECRECGSRTEFYDMGDGRQFHVCPRCRKQYILEFNENEEE